MNSRSPGQGGQRLAGSRGLKIVRKGRRDWSYSHHRHRRRDQDAEILCLLVCRVKHSLSVQYAKGHELTDELHGLLVKDRRIVMCFSNEFVYILNVKSWK